MKIILAGILIAGAMMWNGVTTPAKGRAGGADRIPSTANPPGKQRKTVAVPEPATLMLIGSGLGSAVLARARASRRTKARH